MGQNPPLKRREIWAIRIQLQTFHQIRGLAIFDHAIDSKLRSCDVVKLRAGDVRHGNTISNRVMVIQERT